MKKSCCVVVCDVIEWLSTGCFQKAA